MKKVSTVAAIQSKKTSEQKLTVGLDLGDRSSWYCVLDESGAVVLEQRLSTTPKAIGEVFGGMPRSRIAQYRLPQMSTLSSVSAAKREVSRHFQIVTTGRKYPAEPATPTILIS